MNPQRVIDVQPAEGFRLRLTFADGHRFELDFWPMIAGESGPLCEPLKDLSVFRKVYLNGLTIEWPTGLDICPDGLRHWCEVGKILPDPSSPSRLIAG